MTVVVYTAGPSCQACRMTKRHLERRNITYSEAMLDAMTITDDSLKQAPVVHVVTDTGEQYWDSYRPDRIDALAP